MYADPLPAVVATAATSVASNGFTYNWDTFPGADHYIIRIGTSSGGTDIYSAAGTSGFHFTLGISPNTTYYYSVRAYNGGGTIIGDWSNEITVTTLTAGPPAPVASAATIITTTSFSAHWAASTGAVSYILRVGTSSGATDIVNDLNVGNNLTQSVTGLNANTAYYYTVKAVDAGATLSTASNEITATTLPGAPTATAATSITATGFTANWNTLSGATTGYRLDVSASPTFANFVYVDLDEGALTSTTVGSLSGGTTYYYRVRAYNAGGTGVSSGTITVLTIPAAPVASAATSVVATSFSANWAASTGAASYILRVGTTSGGTDILNDENEGTNLTKSVTGLSPNIQYYYTVRAINASGTSSASTEINPMTPPTAPVANAATSLTSTGFTANWSAAAGATGYRLDVSTSNTFATFVSGYNDLNVNAATLYSVTGLTGGQTYYYRVRAYNAGATSASSGTITVLTMPAVPTWSAATLITTSSFSINWVDTLATSYILRVGTSSGGTEIVNDVNVGNVLTYSLTGLNSNTRYYYTVKAINASGTSAASTLRNTYTLSVAPVADAATSLTETTFTAHWSDDNGPGIEKIGKEKGGLQVTGGVEAVNKVNSWGHGYRIDVSTSASFNSFVSGYQDYNVGNHTWLCVTGLTGGTTYYYRVREYNADGTSTSSGTITALTVPAAPVANAADPVTSFSFNANWAASTGTDSYLLRVGTSPGGTEILNDENVGNVLTYSVTDLNENFTYYYTVKAVNASGTSSCSGTITVQTLPLSPVANEAISITTTGFIANWSAPFIPAGIEKVGKKKGGLQVVNGVKVIKKVKDGGYTYRLDISTSPHFESYVAGFENLDVSDSLSYTVTGLITGTNYYYRVRSYEGAGTIASANSNVISVVTIMLAPIANNATATTPSSFSANWNSSPNAIQYFLDVATDNAFTSYVTGYHNLNVGNVLTQAVTGLTLNTVYYYRVRAASSSATSVNSNKISLTTLFTTPAVPVATAPTLVSTTGFSANWDSTATATKYFLDVATDNAFTTFVTGYNNLDVGKVLTKTITGLASSTTYYYRVRAFNSGGTSGNSNIIGQKTWGLTPNPPSHIEITYDDGGHPILTWTDNSDDESGFDVYRDSGTGGVKGNKVNALVKVGTVPANTTTFDDATAVEGVSYTYSVVATRSDGANSGINTPSGQTPVVTAAPAAPSDLAGVVSGGKITLNWMDNSSVEDGYIIERSASTNTSYTQLSSVAANVTSFNDLNVQNGVTYYYRVKAYKGTVNSLTSNEINVTALATGVEDLSYGIPVDYKLFQNYPNPFNPSTAIRYAIPSDGKVKLVVYNLIGQEVTTLVDKNQNAGFHEVLFDATNFPSGMYIYKIQSSNFVSTRKMILMK